MEQIGEGHPLAFSDENVVSLAALGSRRADQLARIAEAGLVEQGRVFLLSLEAVRLEMGARWEMRREIVWETFERDLTRAMPAPDVFIRLDDTTILAAIGTTDGYSGQVRCAQILRSALEFFLGRNQESDLSISRVSALGPDGVSASRIDPDSPLPFATSSAGAATRRQPMSPEDWKPPLASRSTNTSFVSEREGLVDVAIRVAPVWRLDRELVGAYAIRRDLSSSLGELSDRDRETIDALVVDFLTPLLWEYKLNGGSFAIVCPLTFSTVSGRRSRLDLMKRCAGIADVMARAVVMEVDDISRGTPPGRIRDTLAMCRPMARVMTVSINDPTAAAVLGELYGNHGVAIDAGTLKGARLDMAIKTARRRTANIVVHHVTRPVDLHRLRELGASHFTEEIWAGEDAEPSWALAG